MNLHKDMSTITLGEKKILSFKNFFVSSFVDIDPVVLKNENVKSLQTDGRTMDSMQSEKLPLAFSLGDLVIDNTCN